MPVVVLNPVAGLHVYVVAPLAVNVVELPEHIAAGDAVAFTVGVGVTVTATVFVALQLLDVPVTV